ncbi:MAG: hypothetical protein ACRDNK_22985 [Solirubrobacteraceae bacterium]
MSRATRIACLTAVLACSWVGVAQADGPAGPDPSSNFTVGALPAACNVPASAACVAAAVTYLDAARANLGQPPYLLPANFTTLAPEQQGFVLANLDRVLYGLAPVPGITAALSQDAAVGVQHDTDPHPSDANFNYYTSNWAGGFFNLPLAYEAWMYDDGPGSGNLDCTSNNTAGCWGHRHDILWGFGGTNPLAMGAAAGIDPSGLTGYAMLLGEGGPGYQPAYTYTWSQAVAAGANGGVSGAPPAGPGTGPGGPAPTPTPVTTPAGPKGKPTGLAARVTIRSLRVRGHRVSVLIAAPAGSTLRCALTRRTAHGWARPRYRACTRSKVFSHVRRGRYRLHVLTTTGSATRSLRVR